MSRRVAVFVGVVILAGLTVALGGYDWATGEGNIESLLTDTGVVGPLVFVFVMWLTQPLGMPGLVFMVPAGIVWPYPLAIALSWIGNMGASYIAFAFARWFGKDWVQLRIPQRMEPYNDRLATGGVWPVILLRLVFGQLAPADWLLGVSKVTTRNFLIGTGIGIIPGVVLFVVAGGGLFEYFSDMSTDTRRIIIGVLVALAVSRRVWLGQRRRRAIRSSPG
jgi:uncharacterized membrane protein YdjX (TVP38/TMEM64 family)